MCGANKNRQISTIINKQGYRSSHVGVYVRDLSTGEKIVTLNHNKPFIPASLQKLVTGAAALDILGRGYQFKTNVYLNGEFDRTDGTVHGNFYIVGGGDPGLTAERMWLFVQYIKHLGVRRVEGSLVLDNSFFANEGVAHGFSRGSSSKAYEASVSALSAHNNTVAIHIAPNKIGKPAMVTPFPSIDGAKIVNKSRTVRGGISSILVKTESDSNNTAIIVSGKISHRAKPQYKHRKIWNGLEHFGWVISALFKENGIVFEGEVRLRNAPEIIKKRKPFYTFKSDFLYTYIDHIFKQSSNFTAEMMFKTLSAEVHKKPGTWYGGQKALSNWWEKQSFPSTVFHKPIILNGSGMGGGNRLTAHNAVDILLHAWSKEYFPEYSSALPIGGVDGTLDIRFKRSFLKGKVRGKTGTLNSLGVGNIAGYIFLPHKKLAFSILINERKKSQFNHWILHQKILEAVSR